MDQLESLREKLYEILERGDCEDILDVSRQLDDLILFYTLKQMGLTKKLA
ncbi:MAG TPA: Spo0E family sporulation regulatory protein-aspartic acid phosphatase [Clostridia bacterium]